MNEHPHQRLHKKRGLILRISYILAIGLVILAFQWKGETRERPLRAQENDELTFLDFMLRSQVKEEIPLPDPADIVREENRITEESNIVEVENQRKVEEQRIHEPDLSRTQLPAAGPADEEVVIDDIYRIVEIMPSFPGGLEAFYDYLARTMTYPELDRLNQIEGTVHMQFVIEKDGSISQVEILRGATPRMNREAIRALSSAPRWNPGQQQGQAVRVYFNLPVYFRFR